MPVPSSGSSINLNSQSCENGGRQATPNPHQCDIKATSKRVDSQPIGTPEPPQGHPNATPKLPQGSNKATLMRPSSHPGPGQFRNPKEIRNPKSERSFSRWACCLLERLLVRIS